MSLPILNVVREPGREDLIRFFHRTELHWMQHLGEQTQLDVGTAFVNRDLPQVPQANAILDAALPPGISPQEALEMADEHFAAAAAVCRRWVMNPSAPAERTRPLIEHLLKTGWRETPTDILHLTRIKPGVREIAGLTIIPARASYRHARELAEEMAERCGEVPSPDPAMRHLDDPHWESLLAMKDRRAVATVGVLSAGEVGRIDQLYVTPAHRRQGIGRTMMSRALEICARALFRHVFVPLLPRDIETASLLRSLGFEKIGQIIQYDRE